MTSQAKRISLVQTVRAAADLSIVQRKAPPVLNVLVCMAADNEIQQHQREQAHSLGYAGYRALAAAACR